MRLFWLALLLVACRNSEYKLDTGLVDDTGDGGNETAVDTQDSGDSGDSGETGDTGDTGMVVPDADGDGFNEDEDCDDENAAIHPDADEICDGLDNDCDGEVDEDPVDGDTWYLDFDQDGHGDPAVSTLACAQPSGMVANATDCDDTAIAIHPGATEICDGADNDCDGTVDEPDAAGALTWYRDADGDGYGDTSDRATACVPPSGYIGDDTDCDDANASVYPGATEYCDGTDHDCDGATYEGDSVDAGTWYLDYDGDGYGGSSSTVACAAPPSYGSDSSDCDDLNPATYPGAYELCDGDDNDCDGAVDEAGAIDETTWYADTDGDGYGDATNTADACNEPSGFGTDTSDCDDSDASVYPGAPEACDGTDHDCDGAVNEDDSADASTWYLDYDGDGYGGSSTTIACAAPSGYGADTTDCNDVDAASYPGATETCDAADNDCDGDVDELLTGSGAACPGTSCLNVLEDGTPSGSDDYWLDNGSGPFEEYCDYGTVGVGWSYRADVTVTNATGDNLYDQQVELVLDTAQLVADGKLQSEGADLRVFTQDGPLRDYWFDTATFDTATTSVWLVLPEVPGNGTVDLTLTYGNPDTEAKSLAWHFDEFEADTSGDYDTHYDSNWGTPSFNWDTVGGLLGTDNTNLDYFLQVQSLSVDPEIYVEVQGWIYDNDSIGPMIRESDGTFVTAVACNDYDGAGHRSGQEAIVYHTTAPSNHYQGGYVAALGNLLDAAVPNRIGLYHDGAESHYYLNGTWRGSAARTTTAAGAGLSTFASSGSPGAEYEYLWVGPTPIDFNPHERGSVATAAPGTEGPF